MIPVNFVCATELYWKGPSLLRENPHQKISPIGMLFNVPNGQYHYMLWSDSYHGLELFQPRVTGSNVSHETHAHTSATIFHQFCVGSFVINRVISAESVTVCVWGSTKPGNLIEEH